MTTPRNTILIGDSLEQLRRLPDSSVDCVITSPPYFLLRDYGDGAHRNSPESLTEIPQ
jgi:DNA modification methylase